MTKQTVLPNKEGSEIWVRKGDDEDKKANWCYFDAPKVFKRCVHTVIKHHLWSWQVLNVAVKCSKILQLSQSASLNTVKVRFTRHLKLRAKVPSLSSACRKFSCTKERESSRRILHFHSHNWLPQESSNYDHSIKNNPWFCVWPNPTGNVFTSFARTIARKIFDLS